jgi:hypothetical protein
MGDVTARVALKVYTFNPLEDQRWLEFIHSHPRASVFHTPGWLEALHRTYGYEPIVYTTSSPGATLTNGIVFCRIKSWLTGRRMVSLPFTDHCEPLVQSPEELKEILGSLRGVLDREKLKYIEIRPLSADLLAEPEMQKSNSFCFHVLDLRPALTDLFLRLQKDSIQRKIRRAEREALLYEEGRSEVLVNEFYRLFLLTRRRHKLPPQPIAWFRNLIACLGDQLKIRVASKDGKTIASILTLRFKHTLVYKYGCSDTSVHNLGAMPFLFWRAIEEAKKNGLRELDLGRSDSDNMGLIAFKDRLGAAQSTLTYMRGTVSAHPSFDEGYRVQTAKRVFSCMPGILLNAAGRLLYRHVG